VIDLIEAPATPKAAPYWRRGERVSTPEPIGAIPAGTTGTIVEVRSLHLRDGALVADDSFAGRRYTVGWDTSPRRWTSDLMAATLEAA
jgi:hypothetical protein